MPDDKSVWANGLMNEGIVSTRLGLPGKPMMAEELIIARDIKLARYAESEDPLYRRKLSPLAACHPAGPGIGIDVSLLGDPLSSVLYRRRPGDYDTNLKVYPPCGIRLPSRPCGKPSSTGRWIAWRRTTCRMNTTTR